MAVAYRVRWETSVERVRALLDLSRSTVGVANYMFVSTVVCGVVLGFLGHWWSARWIWLSIAVLVIVLLVMARAASPYFQRIRIAVGLASVGAARHGTAREPSAEQLARALESGNAATVTALAVGGWAVIVWLMLFKPF